MLIAFATSDGVHVDQQFRRASSLAVYEVGPTGHRLDRVCAFAPDRAVKTEQRLDAIRGAAIVYGVAFGPSSVLRLFQRGIRAATAPAGTPIGTVLARHVEARRDPSLPP